MTRAFARVFELLMETAGLAVQAYESGEAFLDDVDPRQPGCVVLDLRMPGVSGIEVLQRLRTAHNEIPAIIISGHADVPTAIRSMKLGAIDLLEKPFEPRPGGGCARRDPEKHRDAAAERRTRGHSSAAGEVDATRT